MAIGTRLCVAILLGSFVASCGHEPAGTSPAPVIVEEAITFVSSEREPTAHPVDGGEEAVTLRDESPEPWNYGINGPLDWLARHQSRDGSWSSFAFGSWCAGRSCEGPSKEDETIGVTGLALLGYFGHGDTHKSAQYGRVVRSGLEFLKSVQGPEGEFARPWNSHPGLQNAWASVATVEAYGMTESRPLKESAERAIRFLKSSRLPCGAWAKEAGGMIPDLETTAWSVMALRSGQLCSLAVEPEDFRPTLAWLDSITDRDTGCVGTDRMLEAETAMAASTRVYCLRAQEKREFCLHNQRMKEDPLLDRAAEAVSRHPPSRDSAPGSMDMRSWYFGTRICAMKAFTRGGQPRSVLTERSDRWISGLLDLQRTHVPAATTCGWGSHDPCEPWGREHGRVATTAMAAILDSFWY